VYSSLIRDLVAWEIGESFFNSLTRRVFATEGVDRKIEFLDADFDEQPFADATIQHTYQGSSLTQLLIAGLTNPAADGFLPSCWDDLPAHAAAAAARLESAFTEVAGVSALVA